MFLDEPSSGMAQRETEMLGEILDPIKTQLDLSIVLIEHDIPLVMGLCDRIVAMESGRVIASGSSTSCTCCCRWSNGSSAWMRAG